jgi:hypothetical protein
MLFLVHKVSLQQFTELLHVHHIHYDMNQRNTCVAMDGKWFQIQEDTTREVDNVYVTQNPIRGANNYLRLQDDNPVQGKRNRKNPKYIYCLLD